MLSQVPLVSNHHHHASSNSRHLSARTHCTRAMVVPQTSLFEIRAYYGGIGNVSVRPSLTFPVRTPVTDLVEPRYSTTSQEMLSQRNARCTPDQRVNGSNQRSRCRWEPASEGVFVDTRKVRSCCPQSREYRQTRAADNPRGEGNPSPSAYISSLADELVTFRIRLGS